MGIPAYESKWNNVCFYQTSLWLLPKHLPLFFVYVIQLEEAKTSRSHLAFGLQRNGLLANNLVLWGELPIGPLRLGCVFCFIRFCLCYVLGATCLSFHPSTSIFSLWVLVNVFRTSPHTFINIVDLCRIPWGGSLNCLSRRVMLQVESRTWDVSSPVST